MPVANEVGGSQLLDPAGSLGALSRLSRCIAQVKDCEKELEPRMVEIGGMVKLLVLELLSTLLSSAVGWLEPDGWDQREGEGV